MSKMAKAKKKKKKEDSPTEQTISLFLPADPKEQVFPPQQEGAHQDPLSEVEIKHVESISEAGDTEMLVVEDVEELQEAAIPPPQLPPLDGLQLLASISSLTHLEVEDIHAELVPKNPSSCSVTSRERAHCHLLSEKRSTWHFFHQKTWEYNRDIIAVK